MKVRVEGLVVIFGAVLLISVCSAAEVSAQEAKKEERKDAAAEMPTRKMKPDALKGGETGGGSGQTMDELGTSIVELQGEIERMRAERESEQARMTDALSIMAKTEAAMKAASKEMASLRERVEAVEANPRAGYDQGFFIAAPDHRFKLSLKGFVRSRYALVLERQWQTDSEGNILPGQKRDTPDRVVLENGFDIQSARLMMDVAVMEMIGFRAELDYGEAADAPIYSKQFESPAATGLLGDRPQGPKLRVLDLFGTYTPARWVSFKAGQFKVSFDKESSFLPIERPFVSGSLMTRRYRLYGDLPGLTPTDTYYRQPFEVARAARFGRDVGAEIGGLFFEERLDIRLGVFNGAGLGQDNDNRDVLTALRIEGRPLGKLSTGIPDNEVSNAPLIAIGAAAAFDLLEHQSSYDPDTRYNSADISATVDVHAKWRGISALGAFFYRSANHGGGRFDVDGDVLKKKSSRSLGGMIQLAYYHAATRLMPAARYSIYDADLDRRGDHAHQATVALTYCLVPEHLDLMLEYSGLFPSDTVHSYLAPRDTWVDDRHDITIMAEIGF